MASSNRLDQRGSTKLARHQQLLVLRARLVGEQKAIAIRPWSHTSVPTVNRKAIYLESNVKWQNMTKDYIISMSSGHRCAAVDLGISILLLPPAVLHNQADKFTWAINSLRRKEWNWQWQRLLQTAHFNFISVALHSIWFLSLDCLSDGRLSQTISKPHERPLQTRGQQLHALLLSTALPWGRQPRLKTKVVSSKVKGKNYKLLQ